MSRDDVVMNPFISSLTLKSSQHFLIKFESNQSKLMTQETKVR